jgi:putative ATP-binding cassette transporter
MPPMPGRPLGWLSYSDCRLLHSQCRTTKSSIWQINWLSPGECSGLAIARVLLAPRWLFLDEATSAMDEADEAAL